MVFISSKNLVERLKALFKKRSLYLILFIAIIGLVVVVTLSLIFDQEYFEIQMWHTQSDNQTQQTNNISGKIIKFDKNQNNLIISTDIHGRKSIQINIPQDIQILTQKLKKYNKYQKVSYSDLKINDFIAVTTKEIVSNNKILTAQSIFIY